MRWLLFLFLLINLSFVDANAQLLDDEDVYEAPYEKENSIKQETKSLDNENDSNMLDEKDSEELYNEMFENYSDSVYDEEEQGVFDKSAEKVVDALSNLDKLKEQQVQQQEILKKELEPLEGDIKIGITKGGFVFFKDLLGRTKCSFGVTVKSTLNRDIKNLSLKLAYPDDNLFAFIFRNVKAKSAVEHFVTTDGDICYNVDGVPHININKCRIHNAEPNECAKRMTWDANLESPDISKHPYRSLVRSNK